MIVGEGISGQVVFGVFFMLHRTEFLPQAEPKPRGLEQRAICGALRGKLACKARKTSGF